MADHARLDTVIETERLMLRVPRGEDFEPWAEFMADPEVSRFLGGAQDRAMAWRNIAAMAGSWLLRGYGMFSFVEKASGRWIGRGGPWYPDGWPDREIGWGLTGAAQGKGFAREAAVACIDFAFDTLGWSEVIHCIDPANAASIRLAERLGSRRRGSGMLPPPISTMVDVYGQSCEEWRSRDREG
ncbi:MAG: GNAT family N-acetyltransferase [Sphingomonadaceae bacterium]|nr:GNAT family N-acetyltransferase [Sphingomonadaceae bacterium]